MEPLGPRPGLRMKQAQVFRQRETLVAGGGGGATDTAPAPAVGKDNADGAAMGDAAMVAMVMEDTTEALPVEEQLY